MLLTDFVLRPLLKTDFAALVALWSRVRDGAEADVASAGGVEHDLLIALTAERSVIVAELDDGIAGFVIVDLPGGRVDHLVVGAVAAVSEVEGCLRAVTGMLIGAALPPITVVGSTADHGSQAVRFAAGAA